MMKTYFRVYMPKEFASAILSPNGVVIEASTKEEAEMKIRHALPLIVEEQILNQMPL